MGGEKRDRAEDQNRISICKLMCLGFSSPHCPPHSPRLFVFVLLVFFLDMIFCKKFSGGETGWEFLHSVAELELHLEFVRSSLSCVPRIFHFRSFTLFFPEVLLVGGGIELNGMVTSIVRWLFAAGLSMTLVIYWSRCVYRWSEYGKLKLNCSTKLQQFFPFHNERKRANMNLSYFVCFVFRPIFSITPRTPLTLLAPPPHSKLL